MSDPIVLIDGDILKYSMASAIEKYDKEAEVWNIEPVHHAYYNVNNKIKRILRDVGTKLFEIHLTKLGDKTNFRQTIDPNYKANRKDVRKPYYINKVHDYIARKYQAVEAEGQEADDTITIRHYELNPLGWSMYNVNSVICSIDKDFDNVPGWHFNPNKDLMYFVSPLQAKRNFYLQILTGDKADNVPRVRKGWFQKKAEERIMQAKTEQEMLEICIEIAEKEEQTREFIERNGQLLWLRTKEDELWRIPG